MASESNKGLTSPIGKLKKDYQNVLEAWDTWNSLLGQMQETNVYLKQQRESSAIARKGLSELTKSLKKCTKTCETVVTTLGTGENKSSVESLLQQCKVTIKAFQEEVDNLTRRCKNTEQAYQTVTTIVTELPDPAVTFQELLSKMESSNEILTKQLQQYKEQIQRLENDTKTFEADNKKLATELQNTTKKLKSATATNSKTTTISKEEYDELIKLRTEIAEYEVEIRSLKNQDVTVRKLEAKIEELQTAGAAAIDKAIQEARAELAVTEGRRVSEALEREADAIRKLQALEVQLQAERAGRVASQNSMLEADEGLQLLEITWDAQRQILVNDNERLREELQIVTKQRDNYQQQLLTTGTIIKTDGSTSGVGGDVTPMRLQSPPVSGVGGSVLSKQDLLLERSAYEAEVAELSETNRLLRDEIRTKDEMIQQVQKDYQTLVTKSATEKSALQSTIQSLENQVANAPTQAYVDSIQRELRILKRLEYNDQDDPEMTGTYPYSSTLSSTLMNDDSAVAGTTTGTLAPADDLETILVAKLRRAESELITERTAKNELREQVQSLQLQYDKLQEDKQKADQLIVSLENDLERVIPSTTTGTPSPAVLVRKQSSTSTDIPTIVTPSTGNPETLQSILEPNEEGATSPKKSLSTATSGVDDSTAATGVADSNSNTTDQSQHSVTTIIMAQRDRLRQRCEILEAERDSFKRELQIQVQTSESLKSDNTKLYEKVRYLQNFGSSGANAGTTVRKGTNNSTAYHRTSSLGGAAADRDLDLEALEQRYEASVDPFKQFNKSERQRKLNEMSSMERMVYTVAKTVLATKEMRTGLFVYVVTLHLLVFVTTYHWSHSSDDCNSNYITMEKLAHLPPSLQGGTTTTTTSTETKTA